MCMCVHTGGMQERASDLLDLMIVSGDCTPTKMGAGNGTAFLWREASVLDPRAIFLAT